MIARGCAAAFLCLAGQAWGQGSDAAKGDDFCRLIDIGVLLRYMAEQQVKGLPPTNPWGVDVTNFIDPLVLEPDTESKIGARFPELTDYYKLKARLLSEGDCAAAVSKTAKNVTIECEIAGYTVAQAEALKPRMSACMPANGWDFDPPEAPRSGWTSMSSRRRSMVDSDKVYVAFYDWGDRTTLILDFSD